MGVIKDKIETYSAEAFRQSFMQPGQSIDALLKLDYQRFFVVKVEDLIRLINLPVPPMRVHTHTLIYLTDGEVIMSIGGQSYTIYKNECLFVPAGQVFSFDNIDLNNGYLCNFDTDFIVGKLGNRELLKDFEFLNVWGNPKVSLTPESSGYVNFLLQRLYLDYTQQGLTNMSLVQAYFMAALYEINQVYEPLSTSPQLQSVALTNQFKEQLFSLIRTHHRVSEYASLLNITPNHLNKVVKQITGKSPTRWIDDMLVLEAKVLLHQTDYSIGQLAAELGIFDASYFSRLFKKYEGVTPLQFRKMIETS